MPFVCIDSRRIRQIMGKLIGNSLKFTEKGAVELRAEFVGGDELSGTLTFSVSDTGCGIAAPNLEKIFQPFVRLHAESGPQTHHGGAGLGLAVCRKLIENMNGTLTLKSEPGKGCQITVVLNSVRFEAVSAPDAPARLPHEPFILLVDDILLNLKVLEAMFKKRGIRTFSALSGAEALQFFSENPVDVVMTDLWMPEMNGMELARALREKSNGKNIRIIAVTADTDAGSNFDLSVFDAVVHKPVTSDKIGFLLQCPLGREKEG